MEINGNCMEEVVEALDNIPDADSDVPTVIIGHPIKGYGVSFMEGTPARAKGMASGGSRNPMAGTRTSRVKVLAALGRPAVTATPGMRWTSAMSR